MQFSFAIYNEKSLNLDISKLLRQQMESDNLKETFLLMELLHLFETIVLSLNQQVAAELTQNGNLLPAESALMN